MEAHGQLPSLPPTPSPLNPALQRSNISSFASSSFRQVAACVISELVRVTEYAYISCRQMTSARTQPQLV